MTSFYQLLACATCRIDAGSAINQATNGAIFVMLGVMTVVFGGFMAVVISFVRKQRAIGAAQLAGSAVGAETGPAAN